MTKPAPTAAEAEALIPQFVFERLLNQDQAGRRISILGAINGQPALLVVERAAFATDDAHLASFAASLAHIKNLGANDIYSWFLASSKTSVNGNGNGDADDGATTTPQPPDLKINLICPCTEKHIKKYSRQGVRSVQETPAIYEEYVRPYMQQMREEGRLNWVYNVLDGLAEQEDVIHREHGEEGFLLAPDLNWDRKTMTSLHLLGIVERRDIWSLRDLKKKHIEWLQHMRRKLVDATIKLYPDIEKDQLKLYFHYQPTYYHLHIHIVHVQLDAGATQAVGKAMGVENVIGQLETLAGGPEAGMHQVTLTYTLGEQSDLWLAVFGPLKEKEKEEA